MVLSWIFTVRPALTETAPAAKADVLDAAAAIVPTAARLSKVRADSAICLSPLRQKLRLTDGRSSPGDCVVKSRLHELGARERRDLLTGSTLAASLSSSGRRPRLIRRSSTRASPASTPLGGGEVRPEEAVRKPEIG